jgi:MFS transporter, MHS family, proline/betaine transporter
MPPLSLPEAGRRHDRAHRAGAARLHRTAADRRRTRRAPLAGGGGTLNEYYDFSLYGYLAVVIAPLFFPSDDPVTSLLAALVVFGTACLIRPLGGIVLGHTGDKYGRKRALLATLICMGVGAPSWVCCPTTPRWGSGRPSRSSPSAPAGLLGGR